MTSKDRFSLRCRLAWVRKRRNSGRARPEDFELEKKLTEQLRPKMEECFETTITANPRHIAIASAEFEWLSAHPCRSGRARHVWKLITSPRTSRLPKQAQVLLFMMIGKNVTIKSDERFSVENNEVEKCETQTQDSSC